MNNRALMIVQNNKAITLIDEIIVKIPDITETELNAPEVLKAIENNKIEMQLMLKAKLFKKGTAQSLTKLNEILSKENNSNISNKYINNLTERWFTGE